MSALFSTVQSVDITSLVTVTEMKGSASFVTSLEHGLLWNLIALRSYITRSNGSVRVLCESVVRTTSKVNEKCHILGSASTETLGSIFKKNCRVDYVTDPTRLADVGDNRFKGGVSAHAWNYHPQTSIFLFFRFHAPRYRSARWTDRRR